MWQVGDSTMEGFSFLNFFFFFNIGILVGEHIFLKFFNTNNLFHLLPLFIVWKSPWFLVSVIECYFWLILVFDEMWLLMTQFWSHHLTGQRWWSPGFRDLSSYLTRFTFALCAEITETDVTKTDMAEYCIC